VNSRAHAKTVRAATLFLALSVCCPGALAQQKSELFSRVQELFKHREPTWKVENVTDNEHQQAIALRQGNRQATVQIITLDSAAHAHETFDGLVIASDNTRAKSDVKTKLQNLGDENYMWTNGQTRTWTTIYFRRGKVIVTVFVPSVDVAKRFAQEILEQIDKG
jgi:hypothetical protein